MLTAGTSGPSVETAPHPTPRTLPPPHVPAATRPITIPPKTFARRERLRKRNLLLVASGGLEPLNDAAFAAAMRVGQAEVTARRGWE